MKIAVWHNLPSGGGKRALYILTKGLVERGHTVEVWCASNANKTYLPLGEFAKEHVLPLEVHQTPKKNFVGKLRSTMFDMRNNITSYHDHCRQCAEEINSGGFDLLFATSSQYMAVAPIGRYVTIPSLLYLQEPTRWLYEAMPRLPWVAPEVEAGFWMNPGKLSKYLEDIVRARGYRLFLREELANIKAYDVVLANSLYSRESILRAYGVNALVCYLGIDTEQFADLHRARENYVIGIGTFNEPKNIDFIIRSLGRVCEPRPRLVWVGNYALPNTYLDFLKQLALSCRVEFEPKVMVTDAEMVELLNRAAMMVYAPRLEPFGLAPLEANACGLPVVAVAEGGVRETVVDGVNGLLADPDEEAMAVAIKRLVQQKDLARSLGEKGRKLVTAKWSISAAIDRFENELHRLVARKSVPGSDEN